MFAERTLLITGGTGSFGHAVLERFLTAGIGEIRIFRVMRRNRTICAGHMR